MSHYRKSISVILPAVIAVFAACTHVFAAAEADLILKNGRVWTGDGADPWVEAIAIRHNRIIAVGNNTDVAALAGKEARVIDLAGRLTLPGFDDAHVHLVNGALRLQQVDLTGACSIAELQHRLRDYATAHVREPWVTGFGWDPGCLADHRLPDRQDLDAAVKDRPVFVSSVDGHVGWTNSKALQTAGISKATKYEPAGKIVSDPSGEPSGILRDGAQSLVRRLLPSLPHERRLAALEQAMKLCSSLGITSVQNAGGDDEMLNLFEDLERAHKLSARVAVALTVSTSASPDTIDHLVELKQLYHDMHLRVTAAEFILDGSVPAHTAAVLEPWADEPGASGRTMWAQEPFNQMLALCESGGLQLWTHASGDRAVRMALDGYDYVRRINETRDARFRIEQADLVSPADIPRFGRLGVFASTIPVRTDPSVFDDWAKILGPQRLGLAFPWHSLEQAGARLVFGSDWPSTISLDPIRAIHCAVNRPSQRVTVDTAVRAYTSNSALASFEERFKGRLKPGMLADIVVLSQNLFNIDPRQIGKTKVDMTIFDGQVIYTRQ